MADTIRTISYLLTNLFQDGQAPGSITPQDVRDMIVTFNSMFGAVPASTHSASYTLALADVATVVESTSASAANITVPPNSSVAFPVGAEISILQYGTGQVTLVAGSGVTLRTPSSLTTRAQYSTIGIRQRATNEWVVFGDLT